MYTETDWKMYTPVTYESLTYQPAYCLGIPQGNKLRMCENFKGALNLTNELSEKIELYNNKHIINIIQIFLGMPAQESQLQIRRQKA